jgi:hypothetical protein
MYEIDSFPGLAIQSEWEKHNQSAVKEFKYCVSSLSFDVLEK